MSRKRPSKKKAVKSPPHSPQAKAAAVFGTYMISRTDAEINGVLNKADALIEKGGRLSQLKYAEGVVAALRWLFGDESLNPMED